MSQESSETRKSVTEHTVELRHMCKQIADLNMEVKALRADIYERWPQCMVHQERIDKLETTIGHRTIGGMMGLLSLIGYAVQDILRRP